MVITVLGSKLSDKMTVWYEHAIDEKQNAFISAKQRFI